MDAEADEESAPAHGMAAFEEPPAWEEPEPGEGGQEMAADDQQVGEAGTVGPKGRKDLAGFKGELDWELSTELYRRYNRVATEEEDEGEGEIYDEMGSMDREQVDMFGFIMTGCRVMMDRMAAAELKDACGGRRGRVCPFCDKGTVEDAEHVFWERPAWKEHRRRYLPLLARLAGPVGPNLTRPLGHFSRWPKWVNSTGLVPNDNELDEQNLVLREGEEEVWRRPGG